MRFEPGGPPESERARRLYRWVAPFYDGFRSLWSRGTRPAEEALDRLFTERIGPGARVLELAPGTGINVERLLRRAPGFGSYLGVDVSEPMLARARERAGGDPRIELRVGDVRELDTGGAPFDFVVCTWLLSHLDDPTAAVRDALERLAAGGTAAFLFFTEPRPALLRGLLRGLGRVFQYRFVDPRPVEALPHRERTEVFAAGLATLVVFRRPGAATG